MSAIDPGWYPDPINRARIRFHDGARWTDRFQGEVSDVNPPMEAGWYPDPIAADRARYFDGQTWSDRVRPMGSPSLPGGSPSRRAGDSPPAASRSTEVLEVSAPMSPAPRRRTWIAAASIAAAVAIVLGVIALRSGWVAGDGPAAGPEAGTPLEVSNESALPPSAAAPGATRSPTPASGGRPPVMNVEDVTASSEMWAASWQRVTIDDASSAVDAKISRYLNGFSNSEPLELVETEPLNSIDYGSIPGSYEHSIDTVPCPEPFLCLVKRGYAAPPGGGSGFGILDALVLDYNTGNVVDISDVIGADDLVELVQATKAAIGSSGDAYSGVPITLETSYKQFADFIPQDDGLLLYFGEYVAGPTPVEVFVSWREIEARRSR